MTDDFACGYLAAIVDGEGHIRHHEHTRRVVITNTDPDIIQMVETCLAHLGIGFNTRLRKDPSREANGWSPVYDVHVEKRSELEKFYYNVPLSSTRKTEALVAALASYKRPPVPPIDTIKTLYKYMSAEEIVDTLDLDYGPETVRGWLRKAGVSLRSAADSCALAQANGRRK